MLYLLPFGMVVSCTVWHQDAARTFAAQTAQATELGYVREGGAEEGLDPVMIHRLELVMGDLQIAPHRDSSF
jgi:hypothetical protein